MKLSDMEAGAAVSLELFIDEKKFEFPSVLEFQKRGKAYFEPIRIGEKLLNVANDKIRVNLVYTIENSKPVMWKEIEVKEEVYKKKVYYTMESATKGKYFNRRGAYRQYVGAPAFAKVGSGKPDIQVVLKDVSTTGFSFIYRDDIGEPGSTLVLIPYVYRDDNVMFDLTLSGKVVRKQATDDGRWLYGCVLVKKNELIAKFVNYKQKEQLLRMNQ